MEPEHRPNKRLRLQRRLRGWSQDDVAAGLHRLAATLGEDELGVDATMVSRWERGTRRPRPRYVRLLCRLFELPPEQLGMVEDAELTGPSQPGGTGLKDRDPNGGDVLRQLGHVLTAPGPSPPGFELHDSEPWQRLAAALRRRRPVDSETVDHLERITVELESLVPTGIPSRVLLGLVIRQLDALTLLLEVSLSDGLRRRLCSLAAEIAGFAGWLQRDMNDAEGAAAYFRTGLEAAREAGDRALSAYLMGAAACQPPYRENARLRLQRIEAAAGGFPASEATPATRVWLAAKEADAHALMGDADACRRALEHAERLIEEVHPSDPAARPRFTHFDRTWLAGERGASLAKLGDSRASRQILQEVLAALPSSGERDRLWLLASLASTYVQDGEPDEACRLGVTVLERAARMGLEPVLQIVRRLRTDLRPVERTWAVRDFDERLRAMTDGVSTGSPNLGD